jgi:hypothetical protein
MVIFPPKAILPPIIPIITVVILLQAIILTTFRAAILIMILLPQTLLAKSVKIKLIPQQVILAILRTIRLLLVRVIVVMLAAFLAVAEAVEELVHQPLLLPNLNQKQLLVNLLPSQKNLLHHPSNLPKNNLINH